MAKTAACSYCGINSDETCLRAERLVVGKVGRKGVRQFHLFYAGASRLARTLDLDEALHRLASDIEFVVAVNSTENLFVHAGVVGWQGQAIVIPGHSFSGKTSLVAALLKAGATYYSDEFAIFDREGRVWPYPRLLSIREEGTEGFRRCPAEELGPNSAARGDAPLIVGLVVVTHYQPDASWQARLLSPGPGAPGSTENTLAARRQPEHALTTLGQVVMRAKSINSKRGEADGVALALLNEITRPAFVHRPQS